MMAPPQDEDALAGQQATKLNKAIKLSQSLNIDVKGVKDLGGAFASVTGELKKLHKELQAVEAEAKKAAAAVGSVQGPSAGGAGSNIGSTPVATFKNSSPPAGPGGGGGGGGMIKNLMSKFGGGGGGGGAITSAGVTAGATVAAAAVQQAMAVIDARVDRNRDYALSADRMSVLYQQMTGKNQVQVQDQYRQPLTKYRLGMGGINDLLGLQARTGINAAQQASSVEAMRTYSGFSLSTGDAANMLQNLASAPVANRMFLMGGGGLIGVGGRQNSMQSVMQNIVKSAGLTNEKLVDSAFASGSLTRSKLTMMGVAPDMQDQILQYAKQNIQYKKKGGKGMYDASSEESRKLMGVEDNFATQAEETDRVRAAREEQMYSRQADNYADLEKQTQKLTKVFAALEDKLSGLIGQRTSHRISSSIGAVAGGILGSLIPIPGLGTAAGAALGSIGGTIIGGLIGEPHDGPSTGKTSSAPSTAAKGSSTNDSNIMVPTYGGNNKPKMVSIESIKTRPDFMGMKAQMRERVLNLMRANPRVGFGQGIRNPKEQNDLFYRRYQKTNRPDTTERKNRKDRKYQGFWWELKNPGDLPTATPGNSMHGIGLAADLYFLDASAKNWAYSNASKFGLSGAGDVDPPHFQPVEFADDSANSYLDKGAPWGSDGLDSSASAEPVGTSPLEATGSTTSSDPADPKSIGATPVLGGYASISERVASDMGMLGGGGLSGSGSDGTGTGNTATPIDGATGSAPAAGALAGEDVARMLAGVGFHGSELIKMLAISKRESGWVPTAHNPDASTGDNSWGLFQLNTLGNLWNFYKQRGIGRPEDLMDANTNVRMAKQLFDVFAKDKHNGFYAWGDYPGSGPGSSDGNLDIPGATAIVKKAGLGEAFDGPSREPSPAAPAVQGSSNMTVKGGHTFNISPSITMNGTGNQSLDLKKLAKELARMVQHEIEVTALRGN
jgi:hypothetical protein